MYTHPTSFHDQNTQIKASSNSVTKFIHPKTWITLMTRIPRCPVQSFFSGCIKFLEFFVRKIRNLCFVKVMTWSMKKMWRPSLRKKKFNPKMIGTYFISTPISKSLQIDRSFFFQLPPIETITSQAINLTPSTVWCRAAYFATLRGWPSWSLRLGHGCLAVFEKKTVMSG